MSISISTKSQLIFNNKEFRCPKCLLIPFINISIKENKLFMSTKCTNNHYYSKPFDEMIRICTNNSISKNFCIICENEKENKKLSNIFFIVQNV